MFSRASYPLALSALVAAPLMLSATAALAGGGASTDAVYGTRGDGQMTERGHEIELRFNRAYAELRVRRTVHNGIERHDQAIFWLEVPDQSVATSLRTLGEVDGRPQWFAGELLEAEAAAARYQELTGLGAYYPKDPALLSWRDQGELRLQVFPVAPGMDKTIEYTLELPAHWEGGRWHMNLPRFGTEAHPAEIRINPGEPLDQLFVDGHVVARGHYLVSDHGVEIALAPRDPEPVISSLASIDTGSRHVVQWRVSVAPKLSSLPKHAKVVIVLDLSVSNHASELEAQRHLALATLAHFEDPALDAQVALLGFDREVHALSPGFVSASEARGLLTASSLHQRNGSELGLALAEAEALLRKNSSKGPERVVLLSDFETASRLSPTTLTTNFKRAVVHLVEVKQSSRSSLRRADNHAWADIAAKTQGVAWLASTPSDWEANEDEFALATFEELARPIRIDQFDIEISGLDEGLFSHRNTLDEGEGIEGIELSATPSAALSIDGLLWNTPLHEHTKASQRESDRWSALVFGTPLLSELDEDEMMTLALRGGAVSPVTSYLAIEPGVRPSTEGLETICGDGLGSGSGAGFGVRGIRVPSVRSSSTPVDKQTWLETQLREGWSRCGGVNDSAQFKLETQSRELLDLELRASSSDVGLHACIEQIAWSLQLPREFAAKERWQVSL